MDSFNISKNVDILGPANTILDRTIQIPKKWFVSLIGNSTQNLPRIYDESENTINR